MSNWFQTEQCPEASFYWWTPSKDHVKPCLCRITTKTITKSGIKEVINTWKNLETDEESILKAGAGGWWHKFDCVPPNF